MPARDDLSDFDSDSVGGSGYSDGFDSERDEDSWDGLTRADLGEDLDDSEDEEEEDEEEEDEEEEEETDEEADDDSDDVALELDEEDDADFVAEGDELDADADLEIGLDVPGIGPGRLGAGIDDDLETGIDDDEDGGDDDEDDSDDDDSGEEAGEDGAAAPARRTVGAVRAAKKTSKKTEADDEVLHPDTPIPTKQKMLKALEWAFEGESDVTPELLERFSDHALLVLKKNREMNLTAVHDPRELAAKLYLDSWRITRLVPLMARRVLDLGSGGGFPGIPLALAEPNLSMTLIDSTHTKADFLTEAIEKLGLRNCRAVWDRAEEYLATERVDVVVVRAVSSVRENVRVLRKVRHSLQDLVMLKGNSWSREVRAAEREAERLGFKLDTVWEHELPEGMGQRAILVYRAPGGAGI